LLKCTAAAAACRFTQLAHNIVEKVTRQPAYLKPPKAGKLREYQMVRAVLILHCTPCVQRHRNSLNSKHIMASAPHIFRMRSSAAQMEGCHIVMLHQRMRLMLFYAAPAVLLLHMLRAC
jgi:hypothetical protein